MINVSNNYKQALTQPRTIDAKITYDSTTINIDDINSIKRSFNSTLFKTIAKQVIIDSNVSIDKDKTINPQFGLYLDNQFEYVSLGSYKTKDAPNLNKDTNSYEITAYDKIVESMVSYELTNSDITYPCTVRQLFVAIFTKLGWTTSGIPATFVNSTSQIEEDVYSNVNMTYRDVLDELCTISCMFLIDVNGTPTLKQKTTTSETINEDFMSDTNVQIKNQVFFNSLVFSRASNSDNIYRKDDTSIANNGLHEFKVSDLQILSLNWRDNFIDAMWNYIKTFTYYAYEVNTIGITYLEPIDTFTLSTFGNTYSTILLNSDLTISNGVNEKIYANEPLESETEYKYADTTDKRINQTYLIVDKQQGQINAVVTQVDEIEQELSSPTSTKQGKYFDLEDALDEPLIDFSLYGETQQDSAILPSEYQQVEYIQNSSGVYINTNFIPKQNTNVELKAEMLYSGTRYLFGVSSSTNRYMIAQQSTGSRLIADLHSSTYRVDSGIVGYETGVHIIKVQNKSMYVDGVLKGTSSCPDFTCDYSAYLFGANNGSTAQVSGQKIYYFKMWDNTTLVRDMMPCYRKSDNEIGMYDLVNNVFYTNAGTGEFTKGNNVTLPTPEYPQDIHNVSGDNTIEICGKNRLKSSDLYIFNSNKYIATTDYTTKGVIKVQPNTTYSISFEDVRSALSDRKIYSYDKNNVRTQLSLTNTEESDYTLYSFTTLNDTETIGFYIGGTTAYNSVEEFLSAYKLMLINGNTFLSYEAYQGNSQLISLGVENLFDKDNIVKIDGKVLNDSGVEINDTNGGYTKMYMPVKPDTTYTISGLQTAGTKRIYFFDSTKTFISRLAGQTSKSSFSFTTPNNCYYIDIQYYIPSNDFSTYQVEKGSKANSFTPYGTTTIELCKIGTYQDYIYKEDDKWYLHKEIGKVVLSNLIWTHTTSSSREMFYSSDLKNIMKMPSSAHDTVPMYATNYIPTNQTTTWKNGDVCVRYSAGSVGGAGDLIVVNNNYNNTTDFINNSSNSIIYYPLANSTDTEITDTTLLEQLNNLMTLPLYKNMTHITLTPNDLQPTMKIEYYRDTALNNSYVPKSEMSNYYTKTETISQIQISNSGIQQNVAEMQTTLDSTGNAINTISNQVQTLQTSTSQQINVINQQLENGVEKVKTTTGYTFDSNGMSITKGEQFKNINTDRNVQIFSNGKEISFMGYDDNLQKTVARVPELESARATIGVHRCETITKNNTKRTAWFYVGGGN